MSKNGMGPPSRSSSIRPPPALPFRFPLMTPSASPPVQRPFGRQANTPSPTKKRRVSRAPSVTGTNSRSFSVASASSSSVSPAFNFDASVDPGEELHVARRASSFRVLNVWSQLAEKYVRQLDEDDIVDLGKETIVKDYGVLRSSNDMYEIGYFADEHDKAERLDNGLPLTPADEEPDELDAFADFQDNISRSETDGDDDDDFGLAERTKRLPPVREVDPADAADLAEFMKAEQLRRETFGDPDEDDEDENEEETRGGDESGGDESAPQEEYEEETWDKNSFVSGSDAARESSVYEDYEERIHDSDGDGRSNRDYSRLSTPSGSPEFDILDISNAQKDSDTEEIVELNVEEPLVEDADSEDELGGWDRNDGSTIYTVEDFSEASSNEEERETLKEPSPLAAPGPSPKPRKKTSSGKSQKAKKPTVSSQVHNTPSKKKAPAPHPLSPAVTQLQTPPCSTSFGPEARNSRVKTTYSRKRRSLSSSPRKTPMRIQSTVSESSDEEAASSPAPTVSKKQPKCKGSRASPLKKVKLVPEVYIDVLPAASPSRKLREKEPAVEDGDLGSPARYTKSKSAIRGKSAKVRGKARAVEADDYIVDNETRPLSPSPEVPDIPISTRSNTSKEHDRADTPKRSSSGSKKRTRPHSPIPEEFSEKADVVDVVMASPTMSSRNPSRRASSSRRSIVKEVDLSDEPGPSSLASTNRRSRPRSSTGHAAEGTSRPRAPPELDTFSFIPPQPPSTGPQRYGEPHFPPNLAHLQDHVPLPNLQDPNAQYHLAQALQSLSILMGGALPFPPSPMHASHLPPPFSQHGQYPWPPYTPRHQNRYMNTDTPQSVATAPPTSSPVGSDYSDSVPSSPTKRPVKDLGRSHTQSQSSRPSRPKSAIREVDLPSRSRSRSLRRVSFSSPEATQIDDNAFEYVSDNVIEVESSDGEDSDFERRRLRREEHSSRLLHLQSQHGKHVRGQTPGPPACASRSQTIEEDVRHSAYTISEPTRRSARSGRPGEASVRPGRKGHR